MYRIIDNRSSGKTSRLMLLAKENDAVFVCANPSAMRIKALAYGITGIDFVDYLEFANHQDAPERNYVVDELENLVKYLINTPDAKMIGYTLSNED